jgi:hypothetical protein
MVGIGMRFAARAQREPNIEDTLIAASIEGVVRDDLRVLAILTTWIQVHHPWINADRLWRGIEQQSDARVRAYWSAIGHMLAKDRRFARLQGVYRGPRVDLLRTGSEFQVRRRGEDIRFAQGPLRVPSEVLRDRVEDVSEPSSLAKRHRTYRYRVLFGPTYRADMWAENERDPSLSAAEIARRTYGSFATAWQVKKDWAVLAAS